MNMQWISIEDRLPPREVWLFTRLGEKGGDMRTFSQESFFKGKSYRESSYVDFEKDFLAHLKERGYTHWKYVNFDLIDDMYL